MVKLHRPVLVISHNKIQFFKFIVAMEIMPSGKPQLKAVSGPVASVKAPTAVCGSPPMVRQTVNALACKIITTPRFAGVIGLNSVYLALIGLRENTERVPVKIRAVVNVPVHNRKYKASQRNP